MEEQLWSVGKVNDGIKAVHKTMDELGLTLLERWFVLNSLEISARVLLGEHSDEVKETLDSMRRNWLAALSKVPVNVIVGDGVADDGDDDVDVDDGEHDAESS